jgi:hypothetical protein
METRSNILSVAHNGDASLAVGNGATSVSKPTKTLAFTFALAVLAGARAGCLYPGRDSLGAVGSRRKCGGLALSDDLSEWGYCPGFGRSRRK